MFGRIYKVTSNGACIWKIKVGIGNNRKISFLILLFILLNCLDLLKIILFLLLSDMGKKRNIPSIFHFNGKLPSLLGTIHMAYLSFLCCKNYVLTLTTT